ncbi:MAG TPA: hypothetical protein VM122_08250 [Usitatibacter sp.]|nr:hypothetical protein [Usitatibacter sp.]
MKSIRNTLATLAAALAAFAAHAGTYSDIWFNPQQPGWGVSIVQQLETAFVTLYVHGPDGKPTWYVASDANVVAYSQPGAFPIFRGTLYRAEGSWHGSPYDAGAAKVIPVGEVSLEALAKDRIRVHYTAEGVTATKEVTRFSFQQPMDLGNFVAQFNLRQARDGIPFGTLYVQADMLLHFNPETGQGFARVDDQLGRRCEYRGPYQQSGKLIRFGGGYTCSSGDTLAGTFEMSDVEITANGMTGYLRATSGTHTQYGRFAAILW